MKKNLGIAAAAVTLLALGACGQPNKQETSETAGFGDMFRRSAVADAPASSASSFRFSLADYIASTRANSALAPYAANGTLLMGNKRTLAVENNFLVEGSAATGKISSNYFLQGYSFSNPFSILDTRVIASQRPLGGSYSIRTLGNTVKEGSLNSAFNYQTMRDYTIAIPSFALSAVGFYGSGGVGGEVALKGEPEANPNRGSIALRMAPYAALFSKLELGAAVAAGIGKAGLQGQIKMFEVEEPVFAELGLNAANRTFGLFKANALEVAAMGGTLSAVASVGVNSLLPSSMQNLWRKYLEHQWKWDVFTIQPTRATSVPGTQLGFGLAQ